MKYILLCVSSVLLTPLFAFASVRINEVAWKGTVTNSSDEWIELYNDSNESVSLAGWKLHISNGTTISLQGSIAAHAFYVLERSDQSTLPDIEGDMTYSGALPNEAGATLSLNDQSMNILDQVSYLASTWTTAQTMQRFGASWIAASPTPKAANVAGGTLQNSENNQEENSSDTEEKKKTKPDDTIVFKHIPAQIAFRFPEAVYEAITYTFDADIFFEDMRREKGYFLWNMGDGTVLSTDTFTAVSHYYTHPGSYVVSLAYYNSPEDTDVLLQSKKVVNVVALPLSIATKDATSLELRNTGKYIIDLSGWKIVDGAITKELPRMLMIAPDASVVIRAHKLGFNSFVSPSLFTPSGYVIFVGSNAPQAVFSSETRIESQTVHSDKEGYIEQEETSNMLTFDDIPAEDVQKKQSRRTWMIPGAAAIIGMALLLLLERTMVRQERSKGKK